MRLVRKLRHGKNQFFVHNFLRIYWSVTNLWTSFGAWRILQSSPKKCTIVGKWHGLKIKGPITSQTFILIFFFFFVVIFILLFLVILVLSQPTATPTLKTTPFPPMPSLRTTTLASTSESPPNETSQVTATPSVRTTPLPPTPPLRTTQSMISTSESTVRISTESSTTFSTETSFSTESPTTSTESTINTDSTTPETTTLANNNPCENVRLGTLQTWTWL
jgi:hypothetical protein